MNSLLSKNSDVSSLAKIYLIKRILLVLEVTRLRNYLILTPGPDPLNYLTRTLNHLTHILVNGPVLYVLRSPYDTRAVLRP
jgi:hypothetical protein